MASVIFILGLMVYVGCEKIHDHRKRKRALKAEAAFKDNLVLDEIPTIDGTTVDFSLTDSPPPYRKGTPPPPYRRVEQRSVFRLKKRGRRMIA